MQSCVHFILVLLMLVLVPAFSAAEEKEPAEVASSTAKMVEVPGGTFSMGDHYGVGWKDEAPVHEVTVSGFLIDKYEVTNEEVCEVFQWALANGHIVATSKTVRSARDGSRELIDLDDWNCELKFSNGRFTVLKTKALHPCIEISWFGAIAYCNFRSLRDELKPCHDISDWSCDFEADGYRLPTEAEWERAARGGLGGHHFPWPGKGRTYREHGDGSCANFWMSKDPYEEAKGYVKSSPVGYYDGNQFPKGEDMANGYGIYDMAGNAWEWCWDYYDGDWYSNEAASEQDTTGPANGNKRVLRGGSWESGSKDSRTQYRQRGPAYHLRCANRASGEPERGRHNRGFRCVRRKPPSE